MNKDSLIKHDAPAQLETGHSINCLSWSAVIVGALVAVALGFLLNIFGMAINLSAYTNTSEGTTTFVVAGFLSMVLSTMIVLFFSGWISGYLGRSYCLNPNFGLLYGLVTWCLALFLMVVLSSSVGDFMNSQYSSVTSSASERFANHTKHPLADTIQKGIKGIGGASHQSSAHSETADNKDVSKALYLVFILFFVGAISSCYGGYVGMQRKVKRK